MEKKIDARVDCKDSFARADILFDIACACRMFGMIGASYRWAQAASQVTARQRFESSLKNG